MMDLTIAHAALIAAFEKEIYDFPEHACCSCERLHQFLLSDCLMTSKILTYGQS